MAKLTEPSPGFDGSGTLRRPEGARKLRLLQCGLARPKNLFVYGEQHDVSMVTFAAPESIASIFARQQLARSALGNDRYC
jgi:hypothetical protein